MGRVSTIGLYGNDDLATRSDRFMNCCRADAKCLGDCSLTNFRNQFRQLDLIHNEDLWLDPIILTAGNHHNNTAGNLIVLTNGL